MKKKPPKKCLAAIAVVALVLAACPLSPPKFDNLKDPLVSRKLSKLVFSDTNLKAAVIAQGVSNNSNKVGDMTWLSAGNMGIADLTGIDQLTSLTGLYVGNNSIADLSPLSTMTDLTNLNFDNNSVSDLSPISALTKLTDISFGNNPVSNINVLLNMPSLVNIYMWGTHVSSSSVVNLVKLHAGLQTLGWNDSTGSGGNAILAAVIANNPSIQSLSLGGTGLSDVSSIGTLKSLSGFYFNFNNISDASPIVALLNGSSSFTQVSLSNNSITNGDAIISALSSSAGTMTDLELASCGVTDIGMVANMTKLQNLMLGSNRISTLPSGFSSSTLFNLDISNNKITSATSIESFISGLTSLTTISVGGNPITDSGDTLLATLAANTKLTSLDLGNFGITTVPAFSGTTALAYIGLGNNRITDITGLENLKNIQSLNLDSNRIRSVAPLATVIKNSPTLSNFNINNNADSDGNQSINDGDLLVAAFASSSHPNLTNLHIAQTGISDITGLSGLTALNYLNLGSNKITDVTALAKLTQLKSLWLYGNQITTGVTALSALTSATYIDLSNNTGILAADVATLRSALPGCTINYP
jgi:internalin A